MGELMDLSFFEVDIEEQLIYSGEQKTLRKNAGFQELKFQDYFTRVESHWLIQLLSRESEVMDDLLQPPPKRFLQEWKDSQRRKRHNSVGWS